MDISRWNERFSGFLDLNVIEISLTLLIILFSGFFKRWGRILIKRQASKHQIEYARELYIRQLFNFTLIVLTVSLIGAVWEISIKGLSIYFSSILAVVGVGLFANWSLLSNMTSSFVIFFFFPYKIGTKVRILDGDNTLEGIIKEIGLFHIQIISDKIGETSIPNNILLQKMVVQLN